MDQCDYCGKEIKTLSTFTCSYCGKTFCPEHRLPFNHNCAQIEAWKRTPPPGQKKIQEKRDQSPISIERRPGTFQIGSKYGDLSPWILGIAVFLLLAIGITIGQYML